MLAITRGDIRKVIKEAVEKYETDDSTILNAEDYIESGFLSLLKEREIPIILTDKTSAEFFEFKD